MRLLAIDTATEACSAAVLADGKLFSRWIELGRGHTDHILPLIDELLKEAQLRLKDLDAIAFGRGPGAFTGVRLAASITQGLAFGAGLKVIGISDLRAVAQRVLDEQPGCQTVLVCNDARMQEVYWGVYQRDEAGLAQLLGAEHVSPPQEVQLPEAAKSPVHGGGRGFKAYPELAQRFAGRLEAIHDDVTPRAAEIVKLAAVEWQAGRTLSAEQAIPVYLRDNVARPASRD